MFRLFKIQNLRKNLWNCIINFWVVTRQIYTFIQTDWYSKVLWLSFSNMKNFPVLLFGYDVSGKPVNQGLFKVTCSANTYQCLPKYSWSFVKWLFLTRKMRLQQTKRRIVSFSKCLNQMQQRLGRDLSWFMLMCTLRSLNYACKNITILQPRNSFWLLHRKKFLNFASTVPSTEAFNATANFFTRMI